MRHTQKDIERIIPYFKLWLVFFTYSATSAVLVQFLMLPVLFPDWHAGHGLLKGGDWLYHHSLAVQLSQTIQEQGWSAWTLRPQGQAPAGIAAVIYTLIAPEPWTLIPLNAFLHASAALILLKIIQLFLPSWHLAIWAVLPFMFYPSAMLWYTQILKNGYMITGVLLFLYGWLLLAQERRWDRWIGVFQALILLLLGAGLVWVVRPYMVQIFQAISIFLATLLTGILLIQVIGRKQRFLKASALSMLIWSIIPLLAPLTTEGITAELPPQIEEGQATETITRTAMLWETLGWIPDFVEEKFLAIAQIRASYYTSYPNAQSMIDREVEFHSLLDIVTYLPRGLQIVLWAPFPWQWFERGSSAITTLMRRFSAFELIGIYLASIGLVFTLWYWRKRIEVWIIFSFCMITMVIMSLAIPNIGSLYRVRYGFIMALVALSIAGVISGWRHYRRTRRVVSL